MNIEAQLKMKDQDLNSLTNDFTTQRPRYEALTSNFEVLVSNLLRSKEIEYLAVEARTKTVESFNAKVARPEKADRYKILSDMTDLSGIRIILFYEENAKQVRKIIEDNFEIDLENSVDKAVQLSPDKFGYLSDHFVVSHSEQRKVLAENIQFADLKAEIQVRTAVQHAWAVIDRNLRYNNESDIPHDIKRKLFRVSALLEIADNQFSEIITDIRNLRAKYAQQVTTGNLRLEINKDSMAAFLQGSDLVVKFERIFQQVGMPLGKLSDGNIGSYLTKFCNAMEISDMGVFHSLLEKVAATAEKNLIAFRKLRTPRADLRFTVEFLLQISIILNMDMLEAEKIITKISYTAQTDKAIRSSLGLPPREYPKKIQ